MTERKSEMVSIGHEPIGRIRQTDRGFELFDESDRYLATAVTLPEGRKYLFQRHKQSLEAANG